MNELMQKVIDEFDGVLIDDYGWEHYQIKGYKVYLMRQAQSFGKIGTQTFGQKQRINLFQKY